MSNWKKLGIATIIFAAAVFVISFTLLRPRWIVQLLASGSSQVVYFAAIEDSLVALTIDDGPDEVSTSTILDILDQHDAHATFFLITERIPGNEVIVRRILAEGNEIGNHLTTDSPSILLAPDEFEQALVTSHEVLSEFSEITWFRPGSGWYDDEMLKILEKYNYTLALGSVYPFDPIMRSSSFISSHVLSNTRPGSIIILHDIEDRGNRTASALATILPELKRRGFRIVTLSELFMPSANEP